MTLRILAIAALGMGSLLLADDEVPQPVQVSKTERIEFPASGSLHLKNSEGEVTIEGWDRPDLEITTTTSTALSYGKAERAKVSKLIDQVKITTERRADEVLVSTALPHQRHLSRLFLGAVAINLEYRIKVPRRARLIVAQKGGEVHVAGLTNDIRVTARNGEITLELPEKEQFTIDARSRMGDVVSDYTGHAQHEWLNMAHSFTHEAPAPAKHVYARILAGDILIRKVPDSGL